MNQHEQDLIISNLQKIIRIMQEEIYNLEEEKKKIKKENDLL
jgi:hypothetical protein